jgi:hypothetical protein
MGKATTSRPHVQDPNEAIVKEIAKRPNDNATAIPPTITDNSLKLWLCSNRPKSHVAPKKMGEVHSPFRTR